MTEAGAPYLGLDLCEIARLELVLERRPRLAARIFTEGERDYAAARRRPARHLAGRFAAKEAAIKALGGGVAPRQIEVVAATGEPPTLRLHGPADELARVRGLRLAVSITHTEEMAAAVVVAS